MKKCLFAFVLVLTLSSFANAEAMKMKIGILPVLDTLPLQVAVHDGLFADQGLDVELIRFSSALERDTAMQTGQLDGYFGDLIASYLLINSGVPMYVGLTSWRTTPNYPMFGIALAPKNKNHTLEQLKGSTLGLSKSTIMEFLADKIEQRLGVEKGHFQQMEVKKIPIRLQMLLSDQLDSAMLPEPLLSLAKLKGGGIFVTSDNLRLPLTVICLNRTFFKDGAEPYSHFIIAYKEAIRRLDENPEQYRSLMAETCRIPKPLVSQFPIYPYPMPSLPSESELDEVQNWMIEKGMLKERIPHELVLSPLIP